VFVKDTKRGYTADGQQKASGKFLMLFQDPLHEGLRPPLRACVRSVHLRQLGHFMMGVVNLAGQEISLSGSYGSDGLPIYLNHKVSHEAITADGIKNLWEQLTPLPQELQDAFWEGGGHNCAGKEAGAMLEWALTNFKELTKPIRRSL